VGAVEKPISHVWPIVRSTPAIPEVRPENREGVGADGNSELKVFTAWDTQSRAKLAAVRYVNVKVDDTSPSEASELQTLRTSFVRVLKDKSQWEVIDHNEETSPEAVIKLRFEPDRTCLGVVLIEIRDTNGKLLWQALVGCRALPRGTHDAMFADASNRLIAKLQEKLKPNSGSDG
jgi:hypothetical protein